MQAAAINKLKIYQAGFTIFIVPFTYLAEANKIVPESSILVALAIGTLFILCFNQYLNFFQ